MRSLTVTIERRASVGAGEPELVLTLPNRTVIVPLYPDDDAKAFDGMGKLIGAMIGAMAETFMGDDSDPDQLPMPLQGEEQLDAGVPVVAAPNH